MVLLFLQRELSLAKIIIIVNDITYSIKIQINQTPRRLRKMPSRCVLKQDHLNCSEESFDQLDTVRRESESSKVDMSSDSGGILR